MKKIILSALMTILFSHICFAQIPFEVTYDWSDNFWIYGQEPDPLVYGFDYFISPEQTDTSLAGKTINIDSIEFEAYGNNLGAVINWDFELHISNQPIGLPPGQYIATHVRPVIGYTRIAPVMITAVIGSQYDTNSYLFSGGNDFLNNIAFATPYLGGLKEAKNQELEITDGLHAQFFFWTGDNRNCHLAFNSGLTLTVSGTILEVDSDGDGIPDNEDNCNQSILDATVIIEGCDSGVANESLDDGCTMTDMVYQCADIAKDHEKFVSCVALLTNGWKDVGLIDGSNKGAIQSCSAQSDLPDEPCPPSSNLSPIPKTGQITSYATSDDGALQKGVTVAPRFTDNGNGTVTDNLTGLIWLKNAACFGYNNRTWHQAISEVGTVENGICNLSDGSTAGDWRLPNLREIFSLVDFGKFYPCLPDGHPFTNVGGFHWYWTSTTDFTNSGDAWAVSLHDGYVANGPKNHTHCIWPVRGGQ